MCCQRTDSAHPGSKLNICCLDDPAGVSRCPVFDQSTLLNICLPMAQPSSHIIAIGSIKAQERATTETNYKPMTPGNTVTAQANEPTRSHRWSTPMATIPHVKAMYARRLRAAERASRRIIQVKLDPQFPLPATFNLHGNSIAIR